MQSRSLTLKDSTFLKAKQVIQFYIPNMGSPYKKDTSPPMRESSSGNDTLALPITYVRRIKNKIHERNDLRRKKLYFSCKKS